MYELLLGRGFRGGGGRWKPLLNRHQARLKAELARLKVHRGVSRNEDLLEAGCGPGAGELSCGVGDNHPVLKCHVPATDGWLLPSLPGASICAGEHSQDLL